MHHGEHMHAISQFLVYQLVWKARKPAPAHWLLQIRKSVGFLCDRPLRQAKRLQEILSKRWTLTMILFGSGG